MEKLQYVGPIHGCKTKEEHDEKEGMILHTLCFHGYQGDKGKMYCHYHMATDFNPAKKCAYCPYFEQSTKEE